MVRRGDIRSMSEREDDKRLAQERFKAKTAADIAEAEFLQNKSAGLQGGVNPEQAKNPYFAKAFADAQSSIVGGDAATRRFANEYAIAQGLKAMGTSGIERDKALFDERVPESQKFATETETSRMNARIPVDAETIRSQTPRTAGTAAQQGLLTDAKIADIALDQFKAQNVLPGQPSKSFKDFYGETSRLLKPQEAPPLPAGMNDPNQRVIQGTEPIFVSKRADGTPFYTNQAALDRTAPAAATVPAITPTVGPTEQARARKSAPGLTVAPKPTAKPELAREVSFGTLGDTLRQVMPADTTQDLGTGDLPAFSPTPISAPVGPRNPYSPPGITALGENGALGERVDLPALLEWGKGISRRNMKNMPEKKIPLVTNFVQGLNEPKTSTNPVLPSYTNPVQVKTILDYLPKTTGTPSALDFSGITDVPITQMGIPGVVDWERELAMRLNKRRRRRESPTAVTSTGG